MEILAYFIGFVLLAAVVSGVVVGIRRGLKRPPQGPGKPLDPLPWEE